MATADERIRLLLEARNNAAGALSQAQQQMQGLNKAAGIAATGIGAIASAAAIGGIVQLGGAIYDLAQNAANFAAVRNSFEGLAAGVGQNADQMLTSMRNASQGMVSDANLVLSANRAMLLGVADTGAEMGTLLEIARVRGRAMGMDVTQAFNDIVTGLGRMSPLILDNLGITVDMEGATARYAQTLGTVSAKLTDAQRKQALLNEVIESSKDLLASKSSDGDAMAASFERAEASIANMKLSLGELFSPAVAAVAQSIADAVDGAMQMADPNRGLSEAQITLQSLNTALQQYNQLLAQNSGTSAYRVDNTILEDARHNLAQLVVDYNLAAMQLNQPIIDYSKMLAGQADFFLAAEQYNPAAEAAARLAAEQAELQTQLDASAASAADFNSVLALIIPNIEGLSDGQINNLAANAQMLFDSLVAGGMSSADALKEVRRQLDVVIPALNGTNDAARAAASGISTLGQVAPGAAAGVSTIGIEAARAAANLGILKGALDNLAGVQVLGKARDILAEFQNTQDARAGWADVRQELRRVGDEGFRGAKAGATLTQSVYMAYDNTRALGGAASAANREFESLKSTVSGLLQGQLTMPGIDIEGMMPREDEINENARRLAAIANEGMGNQSWMEEFKTEVPDIYEALVSSGDPRAMAQQLIRDFQAGLVPQLLDKEAAKEKVRRMLLGQENMAALANEIAQELSTEMGISLAQAQQAVSQSLGTGGKTSGAAGDGTSMLDGAKEGDLFVEGLINQITVRQASLMASGASSGAMWGSGFLERVGTSVPTALIDMLVILVTPGVKKKINDDDSRSGAR